MTDPLTGLELASGIVNGPGAALKLPDTTATPSELLRAAVLPALQCGPCLVSFSGGIDSSLVLSAATQAARERALPDPIPITWRFNDAPTASESDWQEQVVRELGLSDWVRLVAAPGELDFVGPVATSVLARHGLLYPANAFLHAPLLEQARGGTLLTGVGGDQILGLWRWRNAADVLRRRVPLRPRAVLRVGLSRAPLTVRARVERSRTSVDSPWLWPAIDASVRRAYAREVASEPATWPERVRWQATRRHLQILLASLEQLATDAGARVGHPLLEPGFLAAVARGGGRLGLGNRAATVEALLGDLLPTPLSQRRTKAIFDEVFWQAPARDLMARWDGEGIDTSLVDPSALRALWQDSEVNSRTAHLLQSAWLSVNPSA